MVRAHVAEGRDPHNKKNSKFEGHTNKTTRTAKIRWLDRLEDGHLNGINREIGTDREHLSAMAKNVETGHLDAGTRKWLVRKGSKSTC